MRVAKKVVQKDELAYPRREAMTYMSIAKLLPQKEVLLEGYGAKSMLDLTAEQLADLTARLKNIVSEVQSKEVPPALRRKRSNLLAALAKIGVHTVGGWERVNEFLLEKRIAGKLLYEMDVAEIEAALVKVQQIARKYAKEKEVLAWQARNN
jgi:hypothetical protein